MSLLGHSGPNLGRFQVISGDFGGKKGLEEAPSLGIYADPGVIMQRGIARELKEGKRYHRSHKKLVASFENLQHAIQMASRSLTQAL